MKVKTTNAGSIISKAIIHPTHPGRNLRSKKATPTTACAAKNNFNQKLEKLTGLLNCNFYTDCYFVTLTFADLPKDAATAEKHKKAFLRKLRKQYTDKQNVLLWIAVFENHSSRPHYHIILNYADADEIQRLWPHGLSQVKKCVPGDRLPIANYLLKQRKEMLADTAPATHQGTYQSYTRSRNLAEPLIEVTDEYYYAKADTGYRLIDSYDYISDVTGLRKAGCRMERIHPSK